MRLRVLWVLTYLPGLCGFVVLIYFGFAAVVELLTNFGVLHNRNLLALFHPGLWFWCALLAMMAAASAASWLAKRSLRSRTLAQEHLA